MLMYIDKRCSCTAHPKPGPSVSVFLDLDRNDPQRIYAHCIVCNTRVMLTVDDLQSILNSCRKFVGGVHSVFQEAVALSKLATMEVQA